MVAVMAMAKPEPISSRINDWRNGAVVYQVFVDRFVPPKNLEAKRSLYPAPMKLKDWKELPKGSGYDAAIDGYPHVLEFWGGDLSGLRSKLDYIRDLGTDVLYLNPIFKSPSNHKYDTEDYYQVDPQLGTQDDLKGLIGDVHAKGMKLMLDGVFNHIGSTSAIFKSAQSDPKSKFRDWFRFSEDGKNTYLAWAGVKSLPRLQLENPAVRNYLWVGPNSVVRKYLHEGIDGWRLDVGFEIGPTFLEELTRYAHQTKPQSWTVGEILGYPSNWSPSVDGVYNYYSLTMGREYVKGYIDAHLLAKAYDDLVADAGIEPLLKSWLITDNHDSDRLASLLPDIAQRKLLQALQFTLPGAPCLYYGSEVGLTGKGDPANRAPMPWGKVNKKNPDLEWIRKLIAIRKKWTALKVGDYKSLATKQVLAFLRSTENFRDSVIVLVNAREEVAKEAIPCRIGRLMSWGEMEDQISGTRVRAVNGILYLDVPPQTVMILTPYVDKSGAYSPYDRVY